MTKNRDIEDWMKNSNLVFCESMQAKLTKKNCVLNRISDNYFCRICRNPEYQESAGDLRYAGRIRDLFTYFDIEKISDINKYSDYYVIMEFVKRFNILKNGRISKKSLQRALSLSDEEIVDKISKKCNNCGKKFVGTKRRKYCSEKCVIEVRNLKAREAREMTMRKRNSNIK